MLLAWSLIIPPNYHKNQVMCLFVFLEETREKIRCFVCVCIIEILAKSMEKLFSTMSWLK